MTTIATATEKKFFQILLKNKVVREDDLFSWYGSLVMQSQVENSPKESFQENLPRYNKQLSLVGLCLKRVWYQREGCFYWAMVNAEDDLIAQRKSKYSDLEVSLLRMIVDAFVENDSGIEALDKRELLSLLEKHLPERKYKPMDIDQALEKLKKDKWILLENDESSHRVKIVLSPRVILELPQVYYWYLATTTGDDS